VLETVAADPDVAVGALPSVRTARVVTAGPAAATAAGRGGDREAALCRIFAAELDVTDVGPDDDFFDLGGHSLLAMKLVRRIRKEPGCADLKIATLMTAPTVAGILGHLEKGRSGE